MQGEAGHVAERVVRVEAASRGYDVIVGHGVAAMARVSEAIRAAIPRARRSLLISDAGVALGAVAAFSDCVKAADIQCHNNHDALRLRPDESMKMMGTVEKIIGWMTSAQLDRGDVAIAMGGGVVGDLVGFAAASYRRGIPWINVPSTLLAMVDASVGGKTGANVLVGNSLKKNMVGAFWQPSLVVADVALLKSLDRRQMRSGLAECLKHGMLAADFGDPKLCAWTNDQLNQFAFRDPATLVELVARNVAVKARVVGSDEREEATDHEGGRALLNLGHTFGHAIETLPGLSTDVESVNSPLQHGEAVAIGLVAASAASEDMGIAAAGTAQQVRTMVSSAGLPTMVRGLPSDDELLRLMGDDKKVAQGQLRLVLPKGDGRCVVVSGPPRGGVCAGWAAVRG